MATDLYDYRPRPVSPLSTLALAAYLTFKQVDLMIFLVDGPQSVAYVSEGLTAVLAEDLMDGHTPRYWGTSKEAIRASFAPLERRGLVRKLQDGRFTLTAQGQSAINEFI